MAMGCEHVCHKPYFSTETMLPRKEFVPPMSYTDIVTLKVAMKNQQRLFPTLSFANEIKQPETALRIGAGRWKENSLELSGRPGTP